MSCLLDQKDKNYTYMSNEMKDSDGISNKDAVCVFDGKKSRIGTGNGT